MERGGGGIASNGFSTSDKKSSSNSDAARSMKMHSTEAFLSKSFLTQKADNLDRPFDGGTVGGCGGGGIVGPTGSTNIGGANEVALGNINRDDVYVSLSSSCGAAAAGIFANTASATNLQPFDMFAPAANYKSPGGGMVASVGFPFTSAQWTELERQAMIYKYMMCSVPVPLELLFPLTKNFTAAVDSASSSSVYNVRYSRNGDPEPGRCKRTDGKKWRCSRDVAPHQKYCERHLHRGRPRSRKPVEAKSSNNGEISHKKTRLDQAQGHGCSGSLPNSAATSQQVVVATATATNTTDSLPPLLLISPKTDVNSDADALSYKGANRELGLMTEATGMVTMNSDEQRWPTLLVGNNTGLTSEGCSSIYGCSGPLFDQDYVEHHHPLNLFTYSNAIEAPTGFIDAWSIDNLNSSGSGQNNDANSKTMNPGDLSPSLDLSMAMAVGNIIDEGMGKVQLECYGHNNSSKNLNWLGWQPFAQGGPLAEALQPGSTTNPPSPHDSISTPATTVSSPSGVLQRTFFSHSDNSVCNSPTFAAAHASEVAFPRFNQID